MLTINDFAPELQVSLPDTYRILREAHLTVHDAVYQVTLEGSRGLAGGCHSTSDVDLTLLADVSRLPTTEPERAQMLREILQTTLAHWQSPIDVDLAAVFDKGGCCGLRCFNERTWNESIIQGRGLDCFGIYKVQRGFDGYVDSGVRLEMVYPMMVIWRRNLAAE